MAVVRAAESLRGRVAVVLAPLSRPGVLPPGFRLAELETEQGVTLRFEGPTGSLLVELERADESRACFARTQRFNVYYATHRGRGAALAPAEAAVVDVVVRMLRVRERALPVVEQASEPSRRVVVREVEVDRGVVEEDEPGSYYVNPYVGCMLACPFCYASHRADFSRELEGAPRAEWGRWVDVKVGLAERVAVEARVLGERARASGTEVFVRMSPIVTDPYQPIEKRYRVTRGVLEALRGSGATPVVLTRSSSVLEDLELLRELNGVVGMSVTTDDDAIRAAFEPETESIDARLATLSALRDAGVRTFAVIQPMLPMDPARLVDALAPRVSAVRIGPLFEKDRAEAIAERLGRREVLDEAWERATFETLRAALEARGVLVNPTARPWSAFLK